MVCNVGKALIADRCYVTQFSSDRTMMSMTHEWCSPGIAPQIESRKNIAILTYPWWAERILSGSYFFIPDVSKIPDEGMAEKIEFQKQNIQSILTIPIMVYNKVHGYLGFDMVREKSGWGQEQLDFLTVLCDILSDAYEKNDIERAVFNEKERLRITLTSVGDGVITTDNYGIVNEINEVAQTLTGWTAQRAIGSPFEQVFNIINEYTREQCQNPVQKVFDTGKIIGLANHTILISRDGVERPIADSAAPIRDDNGNIHGVVLVFRDVTHERVRQEEIEYLSFHDSLKKSEDRMYRRKLFESQSMRGKTISTIIHTLHE